MPFRHCTWAFLLLLATSAWAQEPAATPSTGYTIFLRGAPVGREDVRVRADAAGLSISSEGRMSVPASITTRKVEIRYAADGTPQTFALEATVNGGDVTAKSTFTGALVRTEGVQSGAAYSREHTVSPQTVVLMPSSFFGAFEAITRRFSTAAPGAELKAYVMPQGETTLKLVTTVSERIQIGKELLDVRHHDVLWQVPGTGDLALSLTATEQGGLVRLSVPSQGLDVVRADVAASTSRTQVFSNPGDEAATIPSLGFNLGATLTRPSGSGLPARLPVVILLAGAGVNDRDGLTSGIPILSQLAGTLGKAGFLAVRYDKRGFGQSGGRAESSTLQDHAEDVRAVVRWLSDRKDVDPKRIAVVGHAEGAWVALLAASRDRKITGVGALAASGATGAEMILGQQQRALETSVLSAQDKAARVALQKQIHSAVISGKGWDGVPPDLRRQADTPWLQSVLLFDPGKTIEDVRQPLLLVHGALDHQVPPADAETLAAVARKESKSKSIEVLMVRGVNHLLVPAVTGEVAEYETLEDRAVSKDVTDGINTWLTKTFAAIR